MTSTFPTRAEMADATVRMLLEIEAIYISTDQRFTLTSGVVSPAYVDCRKIISYPRIRDRITSFSVSMLLRDVGFEQFDAVAGGETAGIPFAAWIARDLELPMHYVRKRPKGFGRAAQIEGEIREGQKVLLVEDLTTDGGSKINFCNALRRAGARTDHASVVFFYDIFPQTRAELAAEGITLHALATWQDVLTVSKQGTHFDVEQLSLLECFLADPLAWSGQNGGASRLSI